LSVALPAGWGVFNSSTPTSIGSANTVDYSTTYGVYDTANAGCIANVLHAGFKNFPSANVCHPHDTCSVQAGYSDRALGVRQTSGTASGGTGLDSGAAFVLSLANTHGMTGVAMSFKLQSLDTTSPRTTLWKLQYGIGGAGGALPTSFTDVTTVGTMTTGGNTFSNNSITASFGTALDNVATNVYIRIVTLDFSTGTGNRASTAIDDVNLTWTGTATTGVVDVTSSSDLGLVVLGDATSNKVTLAYSTEAAGNYDLKIYDITGRTIATQNVIAQTGSQNVTVDGLNLAPGMYIAKMSNNTASSTAKIIVH